MNWKELGQKLIGYAPQLGTLLAGPQGAAIGAGLAYFLGEDEATPEAIASKVERDPEALTKVLAYETTIVKEQGESLRAMLISETNSKQTTRPKIALGCFRVLAFINITTFTGWFIAVVTNNAALVTAIETGWPLIVGASTVFAVCLERYFGVLRNEYKDKINALSNTKTESMLSKIGSMFK